MRAATTANESLMRASALFEWNEDRDPPPSLRAAQREHGRLRERLLREGWTRAGRGKHWYSHRFHPPMVGEADAQVGEAGA